MRRCCENIILHSTFALRMAFGHPIRAFHFVHTRLLHLSLSATLKTLRHLNFLPGLCFPIELRPYYTRKQPRVIAPRRVAFEAVDNIKGHNVALDKMDDQWEIRRQG